MYTIRVLIFYEFLEDIEHHTAELSDAVGEFVDQTSSAEEPNPGDESTDESETASPEEQADGSTDSDSEGEADETDSKQPELIDVDEE